jgi:hypothetical protein
MRIRRALVVGTIATVGILSTACDGSVAYTVVNQTDRPVTAWILYSECEDVTGYKGDYDYERSVGPGDTVEVSDVTGPGSVPRQPWCLQVVDQDRRLLLSEPYDDTGASTYVVTGDQQPGATIPRKDDLPQQPWLDQTWDGFRDWPIVTAFYWLILLGFSAAVAFGAFITVRYFYRTYFKKQRL